MRSALLMMSITQQVGDYAAALKKKERGMAEMARNSWRAAPRCM